MDREPAFADRIVPFPLTGRTDLVRRCAAELEPLHGESALRYWRGECRRLADELLSLGCTDADMRRQVLDFQEEVQAELMRRHQAETMAGHGRR